MYNDENDHGDMGNVDFVTMRIVGAGVCSSRSLGATEAAAGLVLQLFKCSALAQNCS